MKTNNMTTTINPLHLWPYREFDRSVTPAPTCFGMIQYTVEQVAEWIKTNPIDPVQMVVIDNEKALLVDGCHRLKGSIMNNFKSIPVEFTHITMGQAKKRFSEHVIKRFVQL